MAEFQLYGTACRETERVEWRGGGGGGSQEGGRRGEGSRQGGGGEGGGVSRMKGEHRPAIFVLAPST